MKTSNEIHELAAALSKAQSQFTPVLKKAKGVHNSSYVGIINRLMHSSGQWMEHDFGVPPSKHDTHAYGSAITYTKRYCYGSILGIPTTDDDGNQAMGLIDTNKLDNPSQKPVQTISATQLKTLVDILDGNADLEMRILKANAVTSLSDVPKSQYLAIYTHLQNMSEVNK